MGRVDRASRAIAVPPEQAYAALIDPEALMKWLPPEGMSGRFEWFYGRPGGTYRLILTYEDSEGAPGKATADSDVVDARFVEIVPGERVVQEIEFVADDPAFAGTMTMTWSVAPSGPGSLVEIKAVEVPSGISAEDHATGLASSLDNLAAYLEG
jgi:uncharacterized protein YndB with AHSA1/START domain